MWNQKEDDKKLFQFCHSVYNKNKITFHAQTSCLYALPYAGWG